MSKVAISGNASGSGIFTIAAPNSNTDRTLTLPDSAGTLLNSAAQGIPKSALPTGSILQVVHSTYSTLVSGTAGSEVFTGISASITPTLASSKILVIFNGGIDTTGTKNNFAVMVYLRRGTTTGATLLSTQRNGHYHGTTISAEMFSTQGFNYLDSPNTTSAVTYGIFVQNVDGSPNWRFNSNGGNCEFTFMEIAA